MPLDVETYQSNAKECEDRAEQMPPDFAAIFWWLRDSGESLPPLLTSAKMIR